MKGLKKVKRNIVLFLIALCLAASLVSASVCPFYNGYYGKTSKSEVETITFLDRSHLILTQIETFTSITANNSPLTGFAATFEVFDPVTGTVSIETQIFGDISPAKSFSSGIATLLNPISRHAAFISSTGAILVTGLSFVGADGVPVNIPSQVTNFVQQPSPHMSVNGPIIGFSVMTDKGNIN